MLNKYQYMQSQTSPMGGEWDGSSVAYSTHPSTSVSSNSALSEAVEIWLNRSKESRRQRRFDSLARLLSLHSRYSACAAITLCEGEVIIAVNCAKNADPEEIAQLMNQKITVLRGLLRNRQDQPFLSLADESAALDYYKSDIANLKKYGGSVFTDEVIAQALYKVIKSIFNPNGEVDDHAFSQEEIDLLLNSNPVTILVPAELQREDDVSSQDNETFDTAFSLASETPYLEKYNGSSSSSRLFSLPPRADGYRQSPNVTTQTPKVLERKLIKKEEAQIEGSVPIDVLGFGGRALDFSSPVTDRSFSTALTSPSSSNASLAQASSVAGKRIYSSITPDSGNSATAASMHSGRASTFWRGLNDSSSDSDSDNISDTPSYSKSAQPLDYLLISFERTCLTSKESFDDSVATNLFGTAYAMNIYQNETIQQVPFPNFIYKNGDGPQFVSDFHADQLLAYYLKEVKKTDLNDSTQPVIPFGITKLCCDACLILYQFNRVQVRGASRRCFSGALQLFPGERTGVIVSQSNNVATSEPCLNSPQKTTTSVAPKSPWS